MKPGEQSKNQARIERKPGELVRVGQEPGGDQATKDFRGFSLIFIDFSAKPTKLSFKAGYDLTRISNMPSTTTLEALLNGKIDITGQGKARLGLEIKNSWWETFLGGYIDSAGVGMIGIQGHVSIKN